MVHKDVAPHQEVKSSVWKRVGWLVAIYVGSVLALGAFAMLLRLFMTASGMKSH
jgi:hypothetical protein